MLLGCLYNPRIKGEKHSSLRPWLYADKSYEYKRVKLANKGASPVVVELWGMGFLGPLLQDLILFMTFGLLTHPWRSFHLLSFSSVGIQTTIASRTNKYQKEPRASSKIMMASAYRTDASDLHKQETFSSQTNVEDKKHKSLGTSGSQWVYLHNEFGESAWLRSWVRVSERGRQYTKPPSCSAFAYQQYPTT